MLDIVFRDDLARLQTGQGPVNVAVVKRMAMNLLRPATPATSFKKRRKLPNWNLACFETLIRQTT